MSAEFPHVLPTSDIAESDVHLWLVDTQAISRNEAICGFTGLLTADEKDRMARFRKVEKQHQFLIARGALRLILSTCLKNRSAQALTFVAGEHGKPSLSGHSEDLQFNLSHSGRWVLIAVTRGRACGVDIEIMDRSRDIHELANFYFHPQEYAAVSRCSGSPADRLLFYKLWTLKEAFIKADGRGMAIPGNGYYFRNIQSRLPELIVTQASINPVQSWQFCHGYYDDTFSYAVAIANTDNQPVNVCRRQLMFPEPTNLSQNEGRYLSAKPPGFG